jgi:hypothetical protein
VYDYLKYLLVVGIVAIVGYLIWHQRYSQEARIDTAFNSCMKQFGAKTEPAKSAASGKAPEVSDPATALAKGLGDAMTSIVQGFGGTVCGAVKDTCAKDFNGPVCQTALDKFK